MSGTWRGAQREKTARYGSLVLSAESRADRSAWLPSRHRRGVGKPAAALDDHCPIARSLDQWFAARWTRSDRRCAAPRTGLACPAMSLLAFRSSSSGVAGAAGLDEGAYVTDGRRLFRVVLRLDPLRGATTAVLEDCLTLELRSYAAADLWEMRVRLVRRPSNNAVERPIRC